MLDVMRDISTCAETAGEAGDIKLAQDGSPISVNLSCCVFYGILLCLRQIKDPKRSLPELENWEVLCRFLPKAWAEHARSSGAMRRARYISEPATVLRVLLLHLGSGCSLAETAARAQVAGLAKISAVGVFKRLRATEPWLRWLAQQMRGAADLPLEILGRRVRAVDATAVSEPGSTGTDWRVHYALNLADLQCDFFALTDVHQGGESFRRVPIVVGDILVGDRVYASPPGVGHVVGAGRGCDRTA